MKRKRAKTVSQNQSASQTEVTIIGLNRYNDRLKNKNSNSNPVGRKINSRGVPIKKQTARLKHLRLAEWPKEG